MISVNDTGAWLREHVEPQLRWVRVEPFYSSPHSYPAALVDACKPLYHCNQWDFEHGTWHAFQVLYKDATGTTGTAFALDVDLRSLVVDRIAIANVFTAVKSSEGVRLFREPEYKEVGVVPLYEEDWWVRLWFLFYVTFAESLEDGSYTFDIVGASGYYDKLVSELRGITHGF